LTLLARAITYMARDAFNPLFDADLRLATRAASDLGETVATRGGTRGNSPWPKSAKQTAPHHRVAQRTALVPMRVHVNLDDRLNPCTRPRGPRNPVSCA
jgi:hypothetical protein